MLLIAVALRLMLGVPQNCTFAKMHTMIGPASIRKTRECEDSPNFVPDRQFSLLKGMFMSPCIPHRENIVYHNPLFEEQSCFEKQLRLYIPQFKESGGDNGVVSQL